MCILVAPPLKGEAIHLLTTVSVCFLGRCRVIIFFLFSKYHWIHKFQNQNVFQDITSYVHMFEQL